MAQTITREHARRHFQLFRELATTVDVIVLLSLVAWLLMAQWSLLLVILGFCAGFSLGRARTNFLEWHFRHLATRLGISQYDKPAMDKLRDYLNKSEEHDFL